MPSRSTARRGPRSTSAWPTAGTGPSPTPSGSTLRGCGRSSSSSSRTPTSRARTGVPLVRPGSPMGNLSRACPPAAIARARPDPPSSARPSGRGPRPKVLRLSQRLHRRRGAPEENSLPRRESIYGDMPCRITVQRKRKTTLLLDADVWQRFQEEVLRTEGTRATSAEVEKLLKGTDPGAFVEALTTLYPPAPAGLPSPEEVERARPRLPRAAVELIRGDQD